MNLTCVEQKGNTAYSSYDCYVHLEKKTCCFQLHDYHRTKHMKTGYLNVLISCGQLQMFLDAAEVQQPALQNANCVLGICQAAEH